MAKEEVKKEVQPGKGNGQAKQAELPILRPDKTFCSEQKTQPLLIFAQPDHRPEDISKPHIWQAIAHMLEPWSIGWVIAHDESWATEFQVRCKLPGRAAVKVLRTVEHQPFDYNARRTLPEGITVRHAGSAHGWIVERKTGDEVVVMGKGVDHPEWVDEEAVIRWCLDHASVRQPPAGPRRFGA